MRHLTQVHNCYRSPLLLWHHSPIRYVFDSRYLRMVFIIPWFREQAFASLWLLANRPGAAARAPHCSAFAGVPEPWFVHTASCRQQPACDQTPIEKGLFNHRRDAIPTMSRPLVGWGLRRRGSRQIRTSRAMTRLQVSASLQGRRGIKRPPGEGGTLIPELIAAPVEVRHRPQIPVERQRNISKSRGFTFERQRRDVQVAE